MINEMLDDRTVEKIHIIPYHTMIMHGYVSETGISRDISKAYTRF